MNSIERIGAGVYSFQDTCNVYIIVRSGRALLIDLGDGAVLDHLHTIGVDRIDWVLHTHHHRDQCAGDARLADTETRIAVPEREAHYWEQAEILWQTQQLADLYDCANLFDRPIQDVPIDRRITDYETLDWEGISLLALPTPGHTRGSISFLATIEGRKWAFTGDLIHSPGRVWTLHDLHWNYSDPDGIEAALHSIRVLSRKNPDLVAPSHGQIIEAPSSALRLLEDNLAELHRVMGNGFVGDIGPPMAARPRIRRLSPSLLEVGQSNANFYVLLDEADNALLFDYGFPDFAHASGAGSRFVEHSIFELRSEFGVQDIEVFIPTHYHDDHVAGAGFLRDHHGTEIWAFDQIADVLTRPSAYRLPATWGKPAPPDLVFGDGAVIEWGGYRFEARHCPGHTRYAVALFGEIDGRRIAITGDETQLDRDRRLRGGGPVYRNGFTSTDFTTGIEVIRAWEPEVLLTGHDGALPVHSDDLEEVLEWAASLERAFMELAPHPDSVEFAVDPNWIRVDPYLSEAVPGQNLRVAVVIENHSRSATRLELSLSAPKGWDVRPRSVSLEVGPQTTNRIGFEILVGRDARPWRHPFSISVISESRRWGEATEGIVAVAPDPTDAKKTYGNTHRSIPGAIVGEPLVD